MNGAIIYHQDWLAILHTLRDEAYASERFRLAQATTILISELIGASDSSIAFDIERYAETRGRAPRRITGEKD
jgi:hypothetical protein